MSRRQSLQECSQRHQHYAAGQLRQAVQRREPLRHDVRVRCKQVVGQGLPSPGTGAVAGRAMQRSRFRRADVPLPARRRRSRARGARSARLRRSRVRRPRRGVGPIAGAGRRVAGVGSGSSAAGPRHRIEGAPAYPDALEPQLPKRERRGWRALAFEPAPPGKIRSRSPPRE